MSSKSCSTVACRVGSWWSTLPKAKQDLIIVVAGVAIMAAIAVVGSSFGKHGFEAWTWHMPG